MTYDFHYNFIKKLFDAELLFTDTDSLTYKIKSKNVYEEFFKWKNLFDFSNHSKDSKFFNETNKKVIGKMKDEFGGVIVIEFVRLKSKMYSMKKIDGKEYNTAKGVSIATEFNQFKDEFSSNLNEIIRAILNFFILFTKIFYKHKKAQKAQKAQRRNQAKVQKAQTAQKDKNANKRISDFLPLRCFLCA